MDDTDAGHGDGESARYAEGYQYKHKRVGGIDPAEQIAAHDASQMCRFRTNGRGERELPGFAGTLAAHRLGPDRPCSV